MPKKQAKQTKQKTNNQINKTAGQIDQLYF
jgi:hypothetical protein